MFMANTDETTEIMDWIVLNTLDVCSACVFVCQRGEVTGVALSSVLMHP